MINKLIQLANYLDGLGLEKSSMKVDQLIVKATKVKELQDMIDEMNAANPPPPPISTEQLAALTEKYKRESEEFYEKNSKTRPGPGEWTQHPKGNVNLVEVGRIHGEQDAGRRRKDPDSLFPDTKNSNNPGQLDVVRSLKNYLQNGPDKDAKMSLEEALQYAQGYLSEAELSEDEKDAQIAAVQQNFEAA